MVEKALYIVSYSHYEEYDPTLLYGKKVKNWKRYCKRFMTEACQRALLDWKKDPSFIGWYDIERHLVKILQEKDYEVLHPEQFNIWGLRIVNKNLRKNFISYLATNFESSSITF